VGTLLNKDRAIIHNCPPPLGEAHHSKGSLDTSMPSLSLYIFLLRIFCVISHTAVASALQPQFSAAQVHQLFSSSYRIIFKRRDSTNRRYCLSCFDYHVSQHINNLAKYFYWTVNDKESLDRLVGWEVDGIITNFPPTCRP